MGNRLGMGVLAALILLLSACNTITGDSAVQPEKAVQDFAKSVAFDRETHALSFTIPKGLPAEYSLYIHASGRVKMGDSGMSFHLFEEESESNSWEPGKTYRHKLEKASLLEAQIVVGIQEQGKPELLHETQINVDAGSNISISEAGNGVLESEPEHTAPAANTIDIAFPVSDKEKTEFNAAIFEIEPFHLSLVLPGGWTLKERETLRGFDADIVLAGVWSVVDIYNVNGERVGAVGYNTYELYEGAEDNPQAIYNQIALGNNYQFVVSGDSYHVIKKTDSGTTAVADVYYAAAINNGVEKYNKGIVSYNKDLLVYVAAEFAGDKITDEQLTDIAKSVQIGRSR